MRHVATIAVVLVWAIGLAGCGLRDPYSGAAARRHAVGRHTSSAAARTAGRSPTTSARGFMAGYLPYLYGLGPAREIRAVTPRLEHALAAQPMTREDGASPSRPQLQALRLLTRDRGTARVRAIVSDESGVYFGIELALVRAGEGWQVAALKTGGG